MTYPRFVKLLLRPSTVDLLTGLVLVQPRVDAQRLLLVGPGDGDGLAPAEDAAAVGRVVLEGLPRLSVVHALVDGQVVRAAHGGGAGGRRAVAPAEVDRQVGQLVLLAERHGDGHVLARAQLARLPAKIEKCMC